MCFPLGHVCVLSLHVRSEACGSVQVLFSLTRPHKHIKSADLAMSLDHGVPKMPVRRLCCAVAFRPTVCHLWDGIPVWPLRPSLSALARLALQWEMNERHQIRRAFRAIRMKAPLQKVNQDYHKLQGHCVEAGAAQKTQYCIRSP